MAISNSSASLLSAPISSAVSGGFGLLGSYLQYKYNTRLAEKQNQYNIDMWKMQNEYNTPANQMRRYQEAGLNPYLVASQGNSGNAMHAPNQVTPPAPEFSKHLSKLADAFNIEALLTQRAERELKQAQAKDAFIDYQRNKQDYQGNLMFHNNYVYDMNTGRYVWSPLGNAENVTDPNAERYYMSKVVPQTYLPYYRAQLIGSQRSYLAPQIRMANYEAQHYPVTYWVGTVGKGAKAVSDITGVFNPSRYLMPIGRQTRGFVTPTGRVLNY